MSLCPDSAPQSAEEVVELAQWVQNAWDYLAMGDVRFHFIAVFLNIFITIFSTKNLDVSLYKLQYPYASSYMTNGDGELPAYPVAAACDYLAEESLQGRELLKGMAAAVGIFYNATGGATCFDWNQVNNNVIIDRILDMFWYLHSSRLLLV